MQINYKNRKKLWECENLIFWQSSFFDKKLFCKNIGLKFKDKNNKILSVIIYKMINLLKYLLNFDKF